MQINKIMSELKVQDRYDCRKFLFSLTFTVLLT